MNLTRRHTLLIFAGILAVLVGLIYRHMPPEPVYKRPMQHAERPLFDLPTGVDLTFTFAAPGPGIREIWLQHLFTDRKCKVVLLIENRTRGVVLLRDHTGYGFLHRASFHPNNATGDEIAVTYRVEQSQKERFPAIVQAIKIGFKQPRIPIRGELDGKPVEMDEFWPLFQLRYVQPAGQLRFLWPVVAVLFVVTFLQGAGRSRRMLHYLLLGCALVATSALLWSQRYENDWGHVDPDRYGQYGSALAEWPYAASEAEREDLARRYDEHLQSFVALVPVAVALLMQLQIPMWAAYLFLVGLTSFSILLLADWFLAERMRMDPRTVLALVTLLATHAIFLKAFIKVSSDQIGVLVTFAGCLVLALRLRHRFGLGHELAFGGLLLAMALSRPPGLAYLAFFAAAALVVDVIRERRLAFKAAFQALEFFLIPPVVLLSLMFFGFGWADNLLGVREKSEVFHDQSVWSKWYPSMIVTAHFALFAAWGLRREDLRNPVWWIFAVWGIAYLALLAVTQAPFIPRLFLPLVPLVYVLLAPAMQRFVTQRPWITLGGTLALGSANVALMLWQSGLRDVPPPPLTPYLYF